MAKVKLLGDLNHDGVSYSKGDTFEGNKELTDHLINIGTAQDPKAATDEADSSTSDAEATAAQIVSDAESKAADTAKAAQATAEKLVADAKAEAKAEGERIVKAAQDQAAKIVEEAKAEAEKAKAQAKPTGK